MKNLKQLIKLAKKSGRSMPVLRHIKVSKGFATASDLEVWITTPITGIDDGLYLPESVELWMVAGGVACKSDKEISDFPNTPYSSTQGDPICVDKKSLEWVSATASKDDTRYHLMSVYFDADNDCIVSTDGNALSRVTTEVKKSFMIHVSQLKKAFKFFKASDMIRIYVDKDTMNYTIDFAENGHMVGRLTDGKFPNYQQVIPTTDNSLHTNHDAKQLSEFLKVIPKNEKKMQIVSLAINGSNRIKSDGNGIELGGAVGEKKAVISLQAPYLRHAMGFDNVSRIDYRDKSYPVMFSSGNKSTVVMPVIS